MDTLAAWAGGAARRLEAAGLPAEDARRDVVLLARHVLGWDAARWLADARRTPAPVAFVSEADALVARRARREPVAHLTGRREFYGRTFEVSRDVLIPRPETELIVDEALRHLGPAGARAAGGTGAATGAGDSSGSAESHGRALRVLDIGTGSGCLAITLALERPDLRVVATDVSHAALDIARRNVARWDVGGRVECREGAFAAGAVGPFDLLVSNPPYVPEHDRASLAPDVLDYEPAAALFAGPDGLDVVRELLPAAAAVIASGGRLIFEIGHGQAAAVEALVRGSARFRLDGITPDLQGIPRVVVARAL